MQFSKLPDINKMKHHIILRELDESELKSVGVDQNHFYFVDERLMERFSSSENKKIIKIESDLKNKINRDLMRTLSTVPAEIIKNAKLKDGLDQSISYWYYNRFRAYMSVRNRLYVAHTIENFQKILNENVTVFTNDGLLVDYFNDFPSIETKRNSNNTKQKLNYIPLLKFAFNAIYHSFLSLRQRKQFRSKTHLILTGENQRLIDEKTGVIKNKFLARIPEIGTDFGCMEQYIIPKIKGKAPELSRLHLKKQRKSTPTVISSYVLLSTLLKRSRRKRVKEASKKLKTAYSEISHIENFEVRFLLKEVANNHASNLLYTLQYIGFTDLLRKSKAKTLSAIDENSPNTKSIFDAARDLGITTIGIQHGSIHALHPAYIFAKEDSAMNKLPDFTVVWGEYSKEMLTQKSNYDEARVIVIGQPRTDFISEKLLEENALVSKFLRTNKKIVLFATQPQRDEKLRRLTAADVIKCSDQLGNVLLVLKIHPSEDVNYYEQIIADCKVRSEVQIVKNEIDLYQSLNMADLVMTCFSTVGAEAVILRKPLITVDYLDQDVQDYAKMNVAIKATNKEMLLESMKTILEGPSDAVQFKHDEFIEQFAYKIDGNVAERFWKVLSKISEDSKRSIE